MQVRLFEVKGLLRLRDDTQRKTTDRIAADSPAEAVRLVAVWRRKQNGPLFRDWLHVLTH